MKIYFNNAVFHLAGLYDPIEDVPGLALSVHLHGWLFENAAGAGVARMRVEIREGEPDPLRPMIGVAFIQLSAEEIMGWEGETPLAQAIMDGMLGHAEIQAFFKQAAQEALKLPE